MDGGCVRSIGRPIISPVVRGVIGTSVALRVFTLQSSGVVLEPDMSTLTGWTAGANWSITSDPAMVVDQPLNALFAYPGLADNAQGCRNPSLLIDDNGTWYLLYDSADGTNGWRQFLRKSTNKGKTWTAVSNLPGYEKTSSGSWAATAVGYLEKRGSTYYLHRVTTASLYSSPNVGLPADPYAWDIWTTTDIENGPWTGVRDVALEASGWASVTKLPGSTLEYGGEFLHYTQGRDTSYKIGICRSATADGAFVADASPLFTGADFTGSRQAENPRVFFHALSGKYVMLANLINANGQFTDANVAILSDDPEDWSAATIHYIQFVSEGDGSQAIGTLSHFHSSDDGLLYSSSTGDVPILYDAHPGSYPAGWHLQRKIRPAVMRYSSAGFVCSGVAANVNASRAIAHDDFAAWFTVDFGNTTSSTSVGFWFRQTGSSGDDGYRLVVRNQDQLLLQKSVAGVLTTVADSTLNTATLNDWQQRIKIKASGTSIKAWLNGELHIDATDASFASGDTIAFSSVNAEAEVRLFRMHASDEITVSDLPANAVVTLRATQGVFAGEFVADASGDVTIPTDGPFYGLEVSDTQNLTVTPGNAYAYTGVSSGFPTITAQPSNQTVAEKATATFAATVTGATSYRWQEKLDGLFWVDMPGETTATLAISNTSNEEDDGRLFRLIAEGASGAVGTSEVSLTVTAESLPAILSTANLLLLSSSGVFTERTGASATTASGTTGTVGTWRDANANGVNLVSAGASDDAAMAINFVSFSDGAFLKDTSFAGLASKSAFVMVFRRMLGNGVNQLLLDAGNSVRIQHFNEETYVYAGAGIHGRCPETLDTDALCRVVYDGSQADNASRLKFYRDGVQQTLTFTGTVPATTDATLGLALGALYSDGATAPFNGLIKSLAIVGGTLTAEQITAIEDYLTP